MKHCKVISFLIIIVLLLMSGCNTLNYQAGGQASQTVSPAETETQTQGPSPSPSLESTVKPDVDYLLQDQCILSYISALKENNLDNILRLCVSENIAANVKKTCGIDYFGDILRITQTTSLLTTTKQFIYSLLSPVDITKNIHNYSEDTINEFIKAVDPADLNNIQVVMLGTPKVYPSTSDFKIDTNSYTYRYCMFSYNSQTYYQGFLMQKTGNIYKLSAIGSINETNTSNIPFNGVAQKISEDDFKSSIVPDSLDIPSGEVAYNTSLYGENETFLQILKNTEPPVLKTSEDAAKYYTSSIAKGDLYSVLSAFAIKQRAENADLKTTSDRLRIFSPSPSQNFPSEYEFYKDINIVNLAEKQANTLFMGFLCLTSYDMSGTSAPDLTKMLSFVKQNYGSISSLKIKKSDLIASLLTESGQELLSRQAKLYGADKDECRIIEYQIGNKTFIGGMEILNYGGNWSIFADYTAALNIGYLPFIRSDKLDYDSYVKK